jgi:hypothetical protein
MEDAMTLQPHTELLAPMHVLFRLDTISDEIPQDKADDKRSICRIESELPGKNRSITDTIEETVVLDRTDNDEPASRYDKVDNLNPLHKIRSCADNPEAHR